MFQRFLMIGSQRSSLAISNGGLYRFGHQTPQNVRLSMMGLSSAVSPFRQWEKPMVESHGDYRDETYLEEYIGGPLYANQAAMPRLPVPTLAETMDRFLPTALPLVKSDDEKSRLEEACKTFPQEAATLQQRLQARQDGEMKDSSWLQSWWNTAGYLQVRDPVVINVSYFFHFSDDASLPVGSKPFNVMRGATIMMAVADFRHAVCSGTFPAETIGKKTKKMLCSTAFKYMFNGCRIPQKVEDSYRIYDPSLHTHCIVARKGHFFSVDFCDAKTGEPLPLPVLEDALQKCIDMADAAGPALPLGYLTSDNRDDWADAREALVQIPGMEDCLTKLESGAFLLCLDDEEPVSRQQCGEIFLHGGHRSGPNRWFDKSIQIICTDNGKSGFLGEHSMMDGMPMIPLADLLTKTTYASVVDRPPSGNSTATAAVSNIFESITPSLESSNVPDLVNQAKSHFETLIDAHELHVQCFHGYGSNFIKKAGFSPDAYVQMAMQLATYRLFGEQAGTYEATQVRTFLHGRTETTRSVTFESEAFVKRMGFVPFSELEKAQACEEKLGLLRKAVGSHIKFISGAANGLGVDRHFFGLSMLVKDGEKAPALFSDPVFARSKRWRVSTSHLTHPRFENWGYGEVVPDGVGLAYAIKPDCCVFNVTALKEHQWTDRLCHHLEEALLEMRSLVDVEQMKSKL